MAAGKFDISPYQQRCTTLLSRISLESGSTQIGLKKCDKLAEFWWC